MSSLIKWVKTPVNPESAQKVFAKITGQSSDKVMKRMLSEGAFHRKIDLLRAQRSAGTLSRHGFANAKNALHRKQYGNTGYWGRVFNNAKYDVSHPIENSRKYMSEFFLKYNPETKTMATKTPLGIAGSAALASAFPAWFTYDTLKDKDLSPGAKAGRVAANFAIPAFSHRVIPSMAAYTGVDKIFSARSKRNSEATPTT